MTFTNKLKWFNLYICLFECPISKVKCAIIDGNVKIGMVYTPKCAKKQVAKTLYMSMNYINQSFTNL